MKSMVDFCISQFGKIDILFNNAGTLSHLDIDEKISFEQWQKFIDLNLTGSFLTCKHVIDQMLKNPSGTGGSIINMSSFLAKMGTANGYISYSAARGGIIAMTKELARAYAKSKIRVNCICPGALRSRQHDELVNTEEKYKQRLQHNPMGRFGEDVEIADVVAFLGSEESSYITGTDIGIDGGLTHCYIPPQ